MKSLLLLVLILTSGYLSYQLNVTHQLLAAANGELAQLKNDFGKQASRQQTWVQKKIQERESSLEKGAYNQQQGVARRPIIYYPANNN